MKEKTMTNNHDVANSGRFATIFFAVVASFSAIAVAVGPAIA